MTFQSRDNNTLVTRWVQNNVVNYAICKTNHASFRKLTQKHTKYKNTAAHLITSSLSLCKHPSIMTHGPLQCPNESCCISTIVCTSVSPTALTLFLFLAKSPNNLLAAFLKPDLSLYNVYMFKYI